MKSFLRKVFYNNWERKLISLIIASILWVVVNHSLTETKIFAHVPVKVVNIAPGKTIEGIRSNQILAKKISLKLVGNRKILSELTEGDLQVVIDARGKTGDWVATISKKNLIVFNSNLNLMLGIQTVSHPELIIRLVNSITEKIPVIITNPIGDCPQGYQYLDVWPNQLYLTVTGSEKEVKQLRSKGIKLAFNLNNISKNELDLLIETKKGDEVPFIIPDSWKKISLPSLSDLPFVIDDPRAHLLRIDFALTQNISVASQIPIVLFYPPNTLAKYNPSTCSLQYSSFIKNISGIPIIQQELFAQKTSRLFVEIVRDMLQIVIVASPKGLQENFSWNVEFISPHELENRYVARILSESSDDQMQELQPSLKEEYLRYRFRTFMNSFRLFLPNNQKLSLKIWLENNKLRVEPKSYPNLF